jgi:hypothetical protein
MAECECLERCLFFNDKMADMPSTTEMYKRKYCRGDSLGCARHIVFAALGRGRVPADLYPHEVAQAEQLVAAGQGGGRSATEN